MANESSETAPPLTTFDKKVIDNFYWSYHFSQGNPEVQKHLGLFVASKLSNNIKPYDLNRLTPYVEKLGPPKNHLDNKDEIFDPLDQPGGIRVQWDEQKEAFRQLSEVSLKDTELRNTVGSILFGTVQGDIRYQRYERSNRKQGEDQHESFFRTYVLEGKDAHTEEFNDLFNTIKKMLSESGILKAIQNHKLTEINPANIDFLERTGRAAFFLEQLTDLVKKWGENHPGQEFYTEPMKPDQ